MKRTRQKRDDLIQNSDLIFKRAEKIDAGSSKVLGDMMNQQRAALASIESLSTNDQAAMQNMVQLKGNLEGKVQDSLLKLMDIRTSADLQMAITNAGTMAELNKIWADFTNYQQKLASTLLTDLLPGAMEILALGDKADPEDLRRLKNAENMIRGVIYAETGEWNEWFTKQMIMINPALADLGLAKSIATMGGAPRMSSFQAPGIASVAFANQPTADAYNKHSSPPTGP